MTDGQPRIVVLHALRPTSRQTTIAHLIGFRERLPNCDVRYLHFAQPLPRDLDIPRVDILIVNYDFLNYRFTPLWPFIRDHWRELAKRARFRVAITQDEFWASHLLDKWCASWNIDRVLTPLEVNRDLVFRRAQLSSDFVTVHTGYADKSIAQGPPVKDRPIDLGQRVRRMPPSLGLFGQEKSWQSMRLAEYACRDGLIVDVSDDVADAFVGGAWFDFLRNCRFTVGMKGGSSRIDRIGLEYLRVQRYLARNPNADYAAVSENCFRTPDTIEMSAISPRLFEAAATGTCQILAPDDYLGVLRPWVHYLPLERDFSNVRMILSAMRNLDTAQEIAMKAREALIDSGNFDYARFVEAATSDVPQHSGERGGDAEWRSWTAALEFTELLWREDGPIFHDAVQEAIRSLLDLGISPNEEISRRLNQRMQVQRVALTEVLDRIHVLGRQEWFARMLKDSRASSAWRRSPWNWRPVTPSNPLSVLTQ